MNEQFIEDTILELAEQLDETDPHQWWDMSLQVREGIITSDEYHAKFYAGDTGGTEGAFRRALKLSYFPVKIAPLSGGIMGQTDFDLVEVTLREGINATRSIATLIHEWAHIILHRNIGFLEWLFVYTERGELEAEATAYIVCKALGIHLESSARYISIYEKGSADLLGESLHDVKRAAAQILDTLGVRIVSAA